MSDSDKGFPSFACRAVLALSLLADGARAFGAFGGGGIGRFADELAGHGVMAADFAAWVVAVGAILTGLALAVGCFHRGVAVLAIVAQLAVIWFLTGRGGYYLPRGMEHELALIAVALAVWRFGPGMFAYRVEIKREKG